jgi:hypothetical protein
MLDAVTEDFTVNVGFAGKYQHVLFYEELTDNLS